MIYLMGMSHIISLLAASAKTDIGSQAPASLDDGELRFLDWDTKSELLPEPIRFASIHRWHLPSKWGDTLSSLEGGVVKINPYLPKLLREIQTEGKEAKLFVSIAGQEHNDFSLRAPPIPADFEFPSRSDLPLIVGRQIVPLASIKRTLEASASHAIAVFFAIRHLLPKIRIINVVPPPPANNRAVAKIFKVTEEIVPPTSIRLKHYLIYVEIIRKITDQLLIESLAPPSETIGDDGMMLTEFALDTHHGNTLYGEHVLRLMRQSLANEGK